MGNKVELIGYYGSDLTHALSAWCSTSRDLTDDRRARVESMVQTLAKNGHHTPFEKSLLHFLVTCDTATHIHLLKHRIGVSVNAESARYKELKDDKFIVPADWPENIQNELIDHMQQSYDKYHRAIKTLVDNGIDRKRAKESARFFLPYANQVNMDLTFNFRSFMHFQNLRNKTEDQTEVRELADEMLRLVRKTGQFIYSLKGFGY